MSQNVAEASIVLNVDSSRLNAGMNKAAQTAKAKGAEVAKNFKGGGGGGGLGGGGLGGLIKGGAGLGVGFKAAEAAMKVAEFGAEQLYEELIVKSKEYSRELEANERVVSLWADKQREGFDDIKESLVEFGSVMGTTEGIKAQEKAVDRMRQKVEQYSAARKSAENTEKSYDSMWSSGRNFELALRSRLQKTQDSETAKRKEYLALEDEARKKMELQAKALEKLKNPLTNPEALAAVKDYVMAQEDALAALEGRKQGEQDIINLQRKFNITASQAGQMMAANQKLELAKANKEAADWQKSLNNEMLEEAGLIKDTANLVKLDELIKKGADKAQVDRIRTLLREKQNLNRQYTPLQALERGTNQEITFRRKLEFDQKKRDDTLKLLGKAQLDELKKIATGIDNLKDDAPEI